MNLLVVVTPPSRYHVCSTWRTFWEEKFTPVKMKHCGHQNIRKHREINNGEKYIILDVYLNFGNSWPTKRVGMAKRGGGCPDYLTGYRIVCGTRFLYD